MTYKEFKHNIVVDISTIYGSDHSIIINTVTKNNNLTLDALVIQRPDTLIAPSIYLNDFYAAYDKGHISYKDVLAQIIKTYETYKDESPFDIDNLFDYASMKDKVAYKIINFKKNIELLDSVPFHQYLDFAIVFYLYLEGSDGVQGSILITDSLMENFGITLEQLMADAKANTPKMFPPSCMNINDMIKSLASASGQEMFPDEALDAPLNMYVLSNKAKTYGASVILYPNLLGKFAEELGEDLYVIPSSIHEIIFLPASSIEDASELNELICTVNANELLCDEYLSDHYYYYSLSERQLKA